MRPWNQVVETRAFWDPDTRTESTVLMSLKSRLANPGGMKYEDLLRDCCIGLSMVMKAVDELDETRQAKLEYTQHGNGD